MNLEYYILVITRSIHLKKELLKNYKGLPVQFHFIEQFESSEHYYFSTKPTLCLVDVEFDHTETSSLLRKLKLYEMKTKSLFHTLYVIVKDENIDLKTNELKSQIDCKITTKSIVLNNLQELLFQVNYSAEINPTENWFPDLKKTFLLNRAKEYKQLKSALNSKDLKEVSRIAHSLKGVSKLYGFPEFAHIAQNLEHSANSANILKCLDLCQNYFEVLQNANEIYSP